MPKESQRISLHTRMRGRNPEAKGAKKKTGREICEKFGLGKKQYKNFITRYKCFQEKMATEIATGKKGRPAKDSVVTEEGKVADLRYRLARKEARIKQSKMGNELMPDFSCSQKGSKEYMVIYRHKDKYGGSETCRSFKVSRNGCYDYIRGMDISAWDLPFAEKARECHRNMATVL